MKQSMSFEQVVQQVERDAAARRDYFAPAAQLQLKTQDETSILETPNGTFRMRDTAHLHLAELTGIDRRYYTRLRQHAPELLDQNVNFWLGRTGAKTRVIRTLCDDARADARALVSPRYASLDNDGLLAAVNPILDELNATVESADITDENMTIKLVSPRLTGEVQVGDALQAGLVLKNSEVRAGAVEVAVFLKRLVCSNGLIVAGPGGVGAHRRHVGRSWIGGGNSYGELPENADRAAWEHNVWQEIQANVREAVQADRFQQLLGRLSATVKLQSTLEPEKLVDRLGAEYNLNPDLQQRIVGHLSEDYQATLWNLVNAVTRTAEDVDSYSLATSLEELGGNLTGISPRQWERLTSLN